MPRKSISRAEIFAVILALFMLSAAVLAQVGDARELANRSTCAANIRGMMQSNVVYSADNNDFYPYLVATSATTYSVTFPPAGVSANSDAAMVDMYKQKENVNNPSAALWMLVATGSVAPKQFICKSDPVAVPASIVDANGKFYTSFPDGKNFSYSSAYPWAEKDGKVVPAPLWRNTMDAGVAIMSDMAPYFGRTAEDFKDPPPVPATPEARAQTDRLIRDLSSADFATREAASKELAIKGPGAFPGLREAAAASDDPEFRARALPVIKSTPTEQWVITKANSANHFYDGQNIGFADAHAEFQRTPAAGENNDSLWGIIKDPKNGRKEIPIAAGALPHPITGEQGDFDTVMVPTRDAKGNLR